MGSKSVALKALRSHLAASLDSSDDPYSVHKCADISSDVSNTKSGGYFESNKCGEGTKTVCKEQYYYCARDAMLARYMLSSCVRPSVRPSPTSRYCTKTAKRRMTQNAVR